MRQFIFVLIFFSLAACSANKKVLIAKTKSIEGVWLVESVDLSTISDENIRNQLNLLYNGLVKSSSMAFRANNVLEANIMNLSGVGEWSFSEDGEYLFLKEGQSNDKFKILEFTNETLKLFYANENDGIVIVLKRKANE